MDTSFVFLTGVLRGRLGRPAGTAGTGSPEKLIKKKREVNLRINQVDTVGKHGDIRDFKKLLRRRQGLRRLKSEFIFYLRISRYS